MPPVVVSGLPNMTPIFMRIWLMKIMTVFDFEMITARLDRALPETEKVGNVLVHRLGQGT
jgi:hypothetical protein